MRRGKSTLWILGCFAIAGCGHLEKAKVVRPDFPVNSVVSLSPSTSEIIGGSTVSMKLKGRTSADNYPRSVVSVPIVASVKPDYEAIKAINPSVIVLDGDLYSATDLEKIKQVCKNVFVLKASNIKEFEQQLYAMGDLLGFQTNQSDYVDRIEVARNTAAASKPSHPLKVAVIMPGNGGAPLIAGTKTFVADVIDEDGGAAVGPAVDRFVPMNPETMAAQNPDLIILPTTPDRAKADVASLLADPTLRATSAIRNRKIAAIDEDVALRKGGRVDKLIDNIHKAFSLVSAQ